MISNSGLFGLPIIPSIPLTYDNSNIKPDSQQTSQPTTDIYGNVIYSQPPIMGSTNTSSGGPVFISADPSNLQSPPTNISNPIVNSGLLTSINTIPSNPIVLNPIMTTPSNPSTGQVLLPTSTFNNALSYSLNANNTTNTLTYYYLAAAGILLLLLLKK